MTDMAMFGGSRRHLVWATAALAAATIILVLLDHLMRDVSIDAVHAACAALPAWRIAGALLFTAASYAVLTGHDFFALAALGLKVPTRAVLSASFTAQAIGNSLGVAVVTGGAARLRAYSRAGLDRSDVARVVVLTSISFWLGIAMVFGATVLVDPAALQLPALGPLPLGVTRLVGTAALAPVVVWLLLCARGRPIVLADIRLPVPSLGCGFGQLAVGVADIAAAATALWLLVPDAGPWSPFVATYLVAIMAGIVINAPGGLGVFEATMLLGANGDRAVLFSGLLIYRLVYYLVPMALAGAIIGRAELVPVARRGRRLATLVGPKLIAALTFCGGVVLLLSGALPAENSRMTVLTELLPLPFIEASHLAASLVGTALLFLSASLARRAEGAFVLTRLLLVAGAVFSLAKGFDWEEALVLSLVLVLLQLARPAFNRRSALLANPVPVGWVVAMVIAVAASLWVGTFIYKSVGYNDSLWWQFASSADASRFMRASVGSGILAAGLLLWRLLGPPQRLTLSPVDPGVIAGAVASSDRTGACLALTGDKRFFVNPQGDALIAWQLQGSSWIAMGNPIGPPDRWKDLVWRFREAAFAAQGRPVFYQLSLDALPAVLDLGLAVVKLGEEARVDLATFTLAGRSLSSIRQADGRLMRAGAHIEIIAASEVAPHLSEVQQVSEQWLTTKGQVEKHFSVGRFDADYLLRTDLAVVWLDGKMIAFANLWATPDRNELSVDLMRYIDNAPPGVMDYLFAQLMLKGQAAGYRWFSLGMAPLSGLEARPLSPLWSLAGSFVFRRGGNLYGFEGLRAYKAKFRPQWTPRYLACPNGVGFAHALVDVTTLVSARRSAGLAQTLLPQAPPTGLN